MKNSNDQRIIPALTREESCQRRVSKLAKKPKKKGAAAPVDPAVAAAVAKRLALIDTAAALQREIRKEEKEIEQAQLNKFQLHRNWALDKQRLEEAQRTVREKDGLMEDLKAQQMGEIMELKKKLKDYLLDLKEEVSAEGFQGESLNKQDQDMHRNILTGMRTDLRSLKQTQKEREGTQRNMQLEVRRLHDRACYDERRRAERVLREIKEQFDHDARRARTRLEAKRKSDVEALEERKRGHTMRVMAEHAASLASIREYFVDITHNNLEKIKELKGQVAERRQKEELDQLTLRRLAKDNKHMAEPLKAGHEEAYHLRDALEAHEKQKAELRHLTATLLVKQDRLSQQGWEAEVLTQERERTKKEVEALDAKYVATAAEVDQKNGFQRLLLEKRVRATKQEIATRDAQMHRVLTDVARVAPGATRQITGDRGDPLVAKRGRLLELQAQFESLDASYMAMLAAVRGTLAEYGVDPAEAGFEPHASLRDLNRYCDNARARSLDLDDSRSLGDSRSQATGEGFSTQRFGGTLGATMAVTGGAVAESSFTMMGMSSQKHRSSHHQQQPALLTL